MMDLVETILEASKNYADPRFVYNGTASIPLDPDAPFHVIASHDLFVSSLVTDVEYAMLLKLRCQVDEVIVVTIEAICGTLPLLAKPPETTSISYTSDSTVLQRAAILVYFTDGLKTNDKSVRLNMNITDD